VFQALGEDAAGMLAVWVANVHAVLLLFATDTLAGGREKGERFAVNRQRLYPFAAGFSVPVKARSMSPLRNVGPSQIVDTIISVNVGPCLAYSKGAEVRADQRTTSIGVPGTLSAVTVALS